MGTSEQACTTGRGQLTAVIGSHVEALDRSPKAQGVVMAVNWPPELQILYDTLSRPIQCTSFHQIRGGTAVEQGGVHLLLAAASLRLIQQSPQMLMTKRRRFFWDAGHSFAKSLLRTPSWPNPNRG